MFEWKNSSIYLLEKKTIVYVQYKRKNTYFANVFFIRNFVFYLINGITNIMI